MTSQLMNDQQKRKLKNSFRKFVYTEAVNSELIQAFESIPQVCQKIIQNSLFQSRKDPNLTHKQQLKNNAYRYTQIFRLSNQSNNPELVLRNSDWIIELYGFGLNTEAFLFTIQLLGSAEQVKTWRELVLGGKVIGGYGQTELGHGSNVQQLETQAVYDEEKEMFVLNTPKNTATKYWPGCFGLFSTHCILQAKTMVKGKNIGIQTFILPMRDQYLNPLNGIQSGDIGSKIGFLRVDNGYLKINNVPIPRQNMLSKYVQIQPDGTIFGLENKQAIKYGYGSMLNLRIKLVMGFALGYTYSAGRIQYELCEKSGQIQDPLIRKKIIETICTGMGTFLSNSSVSRVFKQYLSALEDKDYEKADRLLIICHIYSSTFKALSSWKSEQSLREAVTRNLFGSFQATHLPKYFTDCVPSVTYEGDNTVLLQQTAKFIFLKQKQKKLTKPQIQVNSDDLEQVLAVFKFVTSLQIRNLKVLIQKSVENGIDFKVVWNEQYQVQIIEVSKVWGRMSLLSTCIQTLKIISENKSFFQKIARVFVSTLIQQTKQLFFNGFKFTESLAWKQFSIDQLDFLRDFTMPLGKVYEPYSYQTRGSKDMEDWIYSRL